MGTKAKIIDRDLGFKALMRRVRGFSRGRTVNVGILSGSAGSYSSGLSVLDVATAHEFGLGNLPERSFLRAWVDADKAELQRDERQLAEEVVRGLTPDLAMRRLGVLFQGKLQKFIQDGRVTPATDKDGTTLIDTAQLVGSISHEVD